MPTYHGHSGWRQMRPFDTAGRAFRRAKTRGVRDTLGYSFRVVQKRLRAAKLDLRYGGRLSGTDQQWTHNPEGRYANAPTDIYALDAMFDRVPISDSDVVVDVGCGDGRVIADLLSRGIESRIIGIELLKDAVEVAARRFRRYPNVQIIHGDGTKAHPEGTLFYLCNPFSAEPAKAFEQSIRGRDVRVVYYNFMHLEAFRPEHWRIEVTEKLKPDHQQYRFAVLANKHPVHDRAYPRAATAAAGGEVKLTTLPSPGAIIPPG